MSLAIGANANAIAASLLASPTSGTAKASAAVQGTSSSASSSSASPAISVPAPSAPVSVPADDASWAARDTGLGSAVQDFLNYANETPGQRMYDAILKSMGLSEQDLQNMTPDQRKAVEQTIEQKIKQEAERQAAKGKTGFIADITA